MRHYDRDKPAEHKTFENLTYNSGQGDRSEVLFNRLWSGNLSQRQNVCTFLNFQYVASYD